MLTVRPITPCGVVEQDKLTPDALRQALADVDCRLLAPWPSRRGNHPYLHLKDTERLEHLRQALLDPQADLVWLVRGGYGLTRLLPRLLHESLEHELQARAPRVVGFSDGTALLAHLWWRLGLQSIHGPNLRSLLKEPDASREHLRHLLHNHAVTYPPLACRFVPPLCRPDERSEEGPPHCGAAHGDPSRFALRMTNGGCLQGTLMPTNLCVLTHLLGTPSMPSLRGCIWLVEDVNEPLYRIDRMLTQLWAAGALRGVVAVVLGRFTPRAAADPLTVAEVFEERCQALHIPLFEGLSMGHEPPNLAVPFGASARIQVQGETASLQL
ncbi:MAG: LD-carboxypeptidase [Myxococcota bacterium]